MNLLDFTAFYFSNKILCILRFVTFSARKKVGINRVFGTNRVNKGINEFTVAFFSLSLPRVSCIRSGA